MLRVKVATGQSCYGSKLLRVKVATGSKLLWVKVATYKLATAIKWVKVANRQKKVGKSAQKMPIKGQRRQKILQFAGCGSPLVQLDLSEGSQGVATVQTCHVTKLLIFKNATLRKRFKVAIFKVATSYIYVTNLLRYKVDN